MRILFFLLVPFLANAQMTGQSLHPDGSIESIGPIEHGLQTGKWQWYYADGTLKSEGYYEKGEKALNWKYYSEKGDLVKIEIWEKGVLLSTKKID